MKIVIELSREDLIAALNAGQPIKGEVVAPKSMLKDSKGAKKAKAEEPEEEFDETEEAEEKPKKTAAKKGKAKPAAKEEEPAEEPEEEGEEEESEETEEEGEEGEAEEDDEYITGEDLVKLKKALNAHKAANGGKPKKTLEILRKYAPGGSEKVKPDVFPKLIKALKV